MLMFTPYHVILVGETHMWFTRTTTHSDFRVCKSMHHCTFQINHQPDATIFQFIILTFIYSSTCFAHFPVHHQELNNCSGSLWFYLWNVVTVVLCSWLARPRTQHYYHHDTKVKPEAATAVIEPDDGRENGRNMLSCK
jgi:hypothetical protein